MHQLKKWAAGGGLVALAACWPLAVGQIAQNVLTDGVANLSGTQLKAEVTEYQRGYLSSTAVTQVQITDPELKAQFEADGVPTEYRFTHQIEHGLLSIEGLTRLDTELVKLAVTTHTSLSGDTRFELSGMPVSLSDSSGGTVEFSDYRASGNIALSGTSELDFSLPSIAIDFASGDQFEVKNFTLGGTGEKAGSFWIGEQKLAMGQMVLKAPDGSDVVNMADLSYQMSATRNEDQTRISALQEFHSGATLIDGQQFDRLSLAFSLNDVNFDALSGIMALYQQSATLSKEEVDKVIPMLETLVGEGLKFNLDKVNLETSEGSINAEIKLDLAPGTQSFAANPAGAINNINGHLKAVTQESMLLANPALKQRVDELIIQEMVKVDGEDYVMAGEVKNGVITFEAGKQMPVWVLLMPLLMGGR